MPLYNKFNNPFPHPSHFTADRLNLNLSTTYLLYYKEQIDQFLDIGDYYLKQY